MNNKLKALVAGVTILLVTGCNANESTKSTQTEATDTLKTVELKSSTVEAKYMGLHAGMTLEEVAKYLQLNKITTDKITAERKTSLKASYKTRKSANDILARNGLKTRPIRKSSDEEILLYSMKFIGIQNHVLKEHKDFKNKKFDKFFLSFTDDKILWNITFLYYTPVEALHNVALKKALEKHFNGHLISEKTIGEYNTKYYQVMMIDKKVADTAIEKYSQTYLNEL